VCRRQVEPHAQIPRFVDGTGDGIVQSDRFAEVLHHFGLNRTIGFQAAVSQTLLVESIQSPNTSLYAHLKQRKLLNRRYQTPPCGPVLPPGESGSVHAAVSNQCCPPLSQFEYMPSSPIRGISCKYDDIHTTGRTKFQWEVPLFLKILEFS